MKFQKTELNDLYVDISEYMVTRGGEIPESQEDYFKNVLMGVQIAMNWMLEDQIEYIFPIARQEAKPASVWINKWMETRKKKNDQSSSLSGTPADQPQASQPTDQTEKMESEEPQEFTSSTAAHQQQVLEPQKWPAKTPLEQPILKELVNFHINYLLGLLENRSELMERTIMLKEAINVMCCGGTPKLAEFHFERFVVG
ncbi:hypothetical protein BDN67DRAFT_1072915 [Paxillus ammoniavirescens]|nr:hypothetical protein BDN67DRAFT_1072915 [Paxillus ammoniavirescens]